MKARSYEKMMEARLKQIADLRPVSDRFFAFAKHATPGGLPMGVHSAWRDGHRDDWGNYCVLVSDLETEWGHIKHLWCRKKGSSLQWGWYELQAIKDKICGPEFDAIEVFPQVENLVDSANMRHLYVFMDRELPFGLHSKDFRTR
tara:strand:+ start:103 stop:537 length:435 start_codon:yes stop_codon:yes gene_type:complete